MKDQNIKENEEVFEMTPEILEALKQSDEDIKVAMNAGANQVTCGSIAVKEPATVEKWLRQYGPNKLILANLTTWYVYSIFN